MAKVFYFSATGNSLYVAKRIAQSIQAELIPMVNALTDEVCTDEVVGFVFPVYYFGLPLSVEKFIKKLKLQNNKYIFAVSTYGGSAPGVGGYVNRILRSLGHNLSYYAKVKSVENFIPQYKVNCSADVLKKAEKKIKSIIACIERRNENRAWNYSLINTIVRAFYPALKNKSPDSDFKISGCIGCGQCERICPRANISVVDGTVGFKGDCELCLGCIHVCPHHAISYKNKMKGLAGYRNPNISIKELEVRS